MPLLLMAAALAAQAAPTLDAIAQADLRCVAVVALALDNASAESKPGLSSGLMYFVGRLDDRAPGLDLEKALRDLYDKGDKLQADFTRCGAILEERGQYLIKVGSALQGKASSGK